MASLLPHVPQVSMEERLEVSAEIRFRGDNNLPADLIFPRC